MNSPLLNYRNRVLNPANPINWEHSLNMGLVGCWMVPPNPGFRGAQTFWDLTRGGRKPNDGTLVNGPTWQPGGRAGGYGSLNFDGTNDYVHCGTPAVIRNLSRITVAAWIKANRTGRSDYVAMWNSGANYKFDLLSGITSGKFQFFIDNGAQSFPSSGAGATAISIGTWYHVVGTYNGATIALYVNRALDASAASSITLNVPSNANLTLGANFEGGSGTDAREFALASLDDVRVYNRALSAGEVAALYDQSRCGHPDTMQWISTRAAFSAGAAPPATPGVFNAAWWMVPNKNIGICRAV